MDFRGITEFLKDSAIYIITFIGVFLFFYFIISFQRISGDSMNPKYENNDIVVLSKIEAKFKIKRNDIIAFNANSDVVYIKRVIAIPGDTVYSENNKIYVNNIEIDENYLKDVVTDEFSFEDICYIDGCELNKIPDNYYFVLGDNREDSIDSRYKMIGLVEKKNIIGKVKFKIFPW